MHTPLHESRLEVKKALRGFVSLLGSSVVSAIGLVIIAANRWVSFDPACAVFIILFIQWQTLGLTIAKTGIEQVVFAMVSERENSYLRPETYVIRKALPLAAIFSLVVLFVFSPWAGFVAFATILLDTWSLIVLADLNARKMFRITAASNLLNYPLFFAAIFTLNHLGRLTVAVALSAFLASSIIRWLWLKRHRIVRTEMEEAQCEVNVRMGLQQGLNYLLFRGDQIVLAAVGLKAESSGEVAMYLFLARFPELVSGVMVIAGTVIFPHFFVKHPPEKRRILNLLTGNPWLSGSYCAFFLMAAAGYTLLWKGAPIPYYLVVPFVIQSLCILPANNLTYSMLRQGYLHGLMGKLAWSVTIGFLLLITYCINRNVLLLSWLVPLQLAAFILLGMVTRWGTHKALYARSTA